MRERDLSVPSCAYLLRRRGPRPFVGKLLQPPPWRHFSDVDVSLRIHGGGVNVLHLARLAAQPTKRAERLQRFPIDDHDLTAGEIRAVDVLLLPIRREGDGVARQTGRRAIDESLSEVLTLRSEYLDAPVPAIGYIQKAVVRHLEAVDDAILIGSRTIGVEWRRRAAADAGSRRRRRGRRIERRLAERTPHPLERPGL